MTPRTQSDSGNYCGECETGGFVRASKTPDGSRKKRSLLKLRAGSLGQTQWPRYFWYVAPREIGAGIGGDVATIILERARAGVGSTPRLLSGE
jgi:hypothetical protein